MNYIIHRLFYICPEENDQRRGFLTILRFPEKSTEKNDNSNDTNKSFPQAVSEDYVQK